MRFKKFMDSSSNLHNALNSEMNKEVVSEESKGLKNSDSIKSPHLFSDSFASKRENSIQHNDKKERISSAHT
jgi:hypothetical protein